MRGSRGIAGINDVARHFHLVQPISRDPRGIPVTRRQKLFVSKKERQSLPGRKEVREPCGILCERIGNAVPQVSQRSMP